LIPYSKQYIDQEDVDAVTAVLGQKFITQGPQTQVFEKQICDIVDAKYSVACNSATSALHLACLAMDIQKNDLVWTSPISFVASANAARYCGAEIDFVDINYETNNICPTSLKEKLSSAKAENKLPKLLIVVHLCGLPCDMKAISSVAQEYGVSIIEDASHALGAKYNGKPIGNCEYSEMCVFSFHAVKIVTTAEGGVVTTQNPKLYKKLATLRSHGIIRETKNNKYDIPNEIFYEQIQLGFNYRMSEIHAALGISQLKKLKIFHKSRCETFKYYLKNIDNRLITLPYFAKSYISAHHLFVIKIEKLNNKNLRNNLFNLMKKNKIQTNLHYIPIFLQPDFLRFSIDPCLYPNAMRYFETALSIPIFPKMREDERNKIVNILNNFKG